MNLSFDFDDVQVIEFGVGLDDEQGFVLVSVDSKVQDALREMAIATREALDGSEEEPTKWEPSEKYAAVEYLYLPLPDEMSTSLRQLHEAANLPTDNGVLDDPTGIFCYFVRMTDGEGQRVTGVRRAAQFKGVLRSRLIRLVSDSLRLVEDRMFKLDTDFDLLIDATAIHILRPSGFEFTGHLQESILAAVPANIKTVSADLPFVDVSILEEYASRHPRAARYLASIQSQKEAKNIDKDRLLALCMGTNVDVAEVDGKIVVEAGNELAFLEVLDRRRYELELVEGQPERFKAASRTRLSAD